MSTRLAFRSALAGLAAALSLASTLPAHAFPFQAVIDEFWIEKDASEIFRDSFSDGVLPPSGPDGSSTYGVIGGPAGQPGITSESGGKLTMTPSLGVSTVITSAFAQKATGARRLLSTDPANPNFLGISNSFRIHGLFDMSSLPQITGQTFGIEITDFAGALSLVNDAIGLKVFKSVSGDIVVALAEFDFGANLIDSVSEISIQSLIGSATQIELILSKDAGTDAIGASYILYGAGHSTLDSQSLSTFSALQNDVVRIYNGEDFTRAQFVSSDLVAVPEPGSLALIALGLTIGLSWRRSKKT